MVKTFLNVVNVFILREEELVKTNYITKGLWLQILKGSELKYIKLTKIKIPEDYVLYIDTLLFALKYYFRSKKNKYKTSVLGSNEAVDGSCRWKL